VAKRRRSDPHRLQKSDQQSLFAFDPIRKGLLKWGTVAGGLGGFFMVQRASLFWQIVGVLLIVLITNYQINKAARYIPRWHAVINAFLGVFLAMFAVIIVGTIILTMLNNGAPVTE
jgi:hypothetical protein